jgi:ubiquinone biosynthesis protein UbiJ
MSDLLFKRLEGELNRRIDASETASALLGELTGRSFAIRVPGAPFTLYLVATPGRLGLDSSLEGTADASVEGSVIAMGRLAMGDGAAAIREGMVRFGGDAEVAEQFQLLLQAARPDLEDELSRFTGDIAAHHIGEGLRSLREFGSRFAGSMGRNLGEYLQEETRELVNSIEVEEFCEDVDRLRDDLARLEARLARLAGANSKDLGGTP